MSTLSRNIRLLITGGGGQLAQAIKEEEATFENVTSIHLSKSELDITSTSSIKKAIDLHQPDVIINTAAYTAVDAAEDNKEKAFLVNEIGVKNLAQACKDNGIKLIHISTDYVFDGEKLEEYKEEDIPNPTTVYGKSKLAGEQAIITSGLLDYAIIRTSWVYSVYSSNFVKTMLRLGNEKDEISVVNDQYGSPTLANNLASIILQLSNVLTTHNAGVYHYTNEGVTTWYAFAKAVFSYKKMSVNVLPVSSDRFVTKATRPKNSKLESSKIINLLGIENVPWEESLEKMLVKL